jgi:hypothetical protein
MRPDQPPVRATITMQSDRSLSVYSGLASEVHALQRELQAFDLSPHAASSDAVLALVRAARRISHLAREVAAAPDGAAAARDEVSLARVTDACLAEEAAEVEPGDLEAAVALIAKRLASSSGGEMHRVQRTLAAIANLPGAAGH